VLFFFAIFVSCTSVDNKTKSPLATFLHDVLVRRWSNYNKNWVLKIPIWRIQECAGQKDGKSVPLLILTVLTLRVWSSMPLTWNFFFSQIPNHLCCVLNNLATHPIELGQSFDRSPRFSNGSRAVNVQVLVL
jgi:hypothetical protein